MRCRVENAGLHTTIPGLKKPKTYPKSISIENKSGRTQECSLRCSIIVEKKKRSFASHFSGD